MSDDEPSRKFFGINAKPFFLQAAVMVLVGLMLAWYVIPPISDYVCVEWDFCTTEERQRLNEP